MGDIVLLRVHRPLEGLPDHIYHDVLAWLRQGQDTRQKQSCVVIHDWPASIQQVDTLDDQPLNDGRRIRQERSRST